MHLGGGHNSPNESTFTTEFGERLIGCWVFWVLKSDQRKLISLTFGQLFSETWEKYGPNFEMQVKWSEMRGTWRSVQFSSFAQSCLTHCDPMNSSTPGFPVHHQHPKFAQTHFHWVSDAIQPSHPLSPPSLPTFKNSWHQGLFKWFFTSGG